MNISKPSLLPALQNMRDGADSLFLYTLTKSNYIKNEAITIRWFCGLIYAYLLLAEKYNSGMNMSCFVFYSRFIDFREFVCTFIAAYKVVVIVSVLQAVIDYRLL